MSLDLAFEFLKMFAIGSGFGLIVGTMIYYKQNKKDKKNEDKEEVN